MLQSHVVEIDGAFVGAAVRQSDGYRFVAVDVRLDDLDGQVWPTLTDLRRQVRVMVLAGRGPARGAPADCFA
jgi:ActR/RegA family two-component response regulator